MRRGFDSEKGELDFEVTLGFPVLGGTSTRTKIANARQPPHPPTQSAHASVTTIARENNADELHAVTL